MVVTRFNPNVNGPLHLGHLYMALVNEAYAHDRQGAFVVRFDDTNPGAIRLSPEKNRAIANRQREDLEWMEVCVDMWQFQSDLIANTQERLQVLDPLALQEEPEKFELPTFIRMVGTNWIPMYYTPLQSATRVLMDYSIGATHIIRGEEFCVELSLYHHYCYLFELPAPKFFFLPRLQGPHGDISKTEGGYTIAGFRSAGYKPEDVRELLQVACLIWPHNGWDLINLKREPRIRI